MAKNDAKGWVKFHRRVEYSPVWKHHNARLLFDWILINASPAPARERTADGVIDLRRGQLFATYEEMARRNWLSVDQVKRAFVVLRDLEIIDWEAMRRGMLVTVLNYRQYQDKVSTEGDDGNGGTDRTAPRTVNRTPENGKTAPQNNDATNLKDNEMHERESGEAHTTNDDDRTANRTAPRTPGDTAAATLPPSSPRAHAPAKNKDQETKNIINPPTPFKKGGLCDSDSSHLLGTGTERMRMVLATWREEREAAGMSYFEDDKTLEGAKVLATEWLGQAQMTVDQLREGMRKLIGDIKSDRKFRNHSLKTLAKRPTDCCPPPPIEKIRRRKIRWKMVCDMKRHEMAVRYADSAAATQASSFAADLTAAQKSTGIMRFVSMFMSGNIRQGSRLMQYIDAYRLGDVGKSDIAWLAFREFVAPAMAWTLVRAVLVGGVAAALGVDSDDDDLFVESAWEVVETAAAPFPVFREIPSILRYNASGDVPALSSPAKAINKGIRSVKRVAKGEYAGAAADAGDFAGFWLGIPAMNLIRQGRSITDMTGITERKKR